MMVKYWQRFSAVALGGFIGGAVRESLELLLQSPNFPFATLLINLTGTFLAVFCTVWFTEKRHVNQLLTDFISVGILGAYTTYATLITETSTKLAPISGVLYIAVSILGSVGMVYLCRWMARKVVHEV